jgi:urate oxidase
MLDGKYLKNNDVTNWDKFVRKICGLFQDTLQQLTGSTEENEHPAWDLYTISSDGHTSQKTTNGRLRRHKDTKIILK